MSEIKYQVYTDGAASGNPGPASIGVVIKADGKIIEEVSQPIGIATNNVAEYSAVIKALELLKLRHAQTVVIHSDSELMCSQLTGKYKVKNEQLAQLFDRVKELADGIRSVEILYIPREQNKQADQLAKKAIKKEQAQAVALPLFRGGEESPSSKG